MINSEMVTCKGKGAAMPEIVHRCPPKGSGVTPCCGMTPFELPRKDRITVNPKLVTCRGGDGMSAHTPGPWRVVEFGSAEEARSALVLGEYLQIIVDHREDFGDPAPDARLIARAPNLLAFARLVAAGPLSVEGANTPEALIRWVLKIRGLAAKEVLASSRE
jgi:hypothetical protein